MGIFADIVDQYVISHSAKNASAVAALFAADAVAWDPIDSDPHVGAEAIRSFFQGNYDMASEFTLTLTGPVRETAHAAAFPMIVTTVVGDTRYELDVIDVMEFDENNLISSMKAYWNFEAVRAQPA
jgi:steroid delta-isomerase